MTTDYSQQQAEQRAKEYRDLIDLSATALQADHGWVIVISPGYERCPDCPPLAYTPGCLNKTNCISGWRKLNP